jgi:hypothetical protein
MIKEGKTLQDFIDDKEKAREKKRAEYLKKIIIVPIPQEIRIKARKAANAIEEARKDSKKTRDGGDDKDYKGILGQWGVQTAIEDMGFRPEVDDPFKVKKGGDDFDIKFGDEIWDVKCRWWWNNEWCFNESIIMAEHEATEAKSCDYYVFCTPDKGYKNIYILGAYDYYHTWEELDEINEKVLAKLPFPAAGWLHVKKLTPFKEFVLRTKSFL